MGKVFWAGAVAAMGERDLTDVTEALRELSRKELVRPARRSSIEGEAEYAFWHILARDVAYGQLPRASRASRHVAAARWIESKASERVEDMADVLAYHYATALELAQAAGQTEQASELEAPALGFLTLAGDRALGLDTAAALSNLERALALAPEGHPERPEALARFGEAAYQAGRFSQAAEALEEAIASFRSAGDRPAAAHAMGTLALAFTRLGDPKMWTLPNEALGLLEPLGRSPELAGALTDVARNEFFRGSQQAAIGLTERALGLAEELGLPRPPRTLGVRGLSRAHNGDPGGLDDLREAIVLAEEAGQGAEVANLYNNLGLLLWAFEGPAASLEVLRGGTAYAKARGLTVMDDFTTASALDPLADGGQFDEALDIAFRLDERLAVSGDVWDLVGVRGVQTRIFAVRGEFPKAIKWLDWLEETVRGSEDAQDILLGMGFRCHRA